ncbi:MAG: hypothetical protein K2Z81_17880, partial [Cyanobacteria bacterium]|nr:hypothetical protein [Cyanobacteriota bacterium]
RSKSGYYAAIVDDREATGGTYMQLSKITSILVSLSFALSVGSAQAQYGSDEISSYQRLLQMRIDKGKNSGQLTGQEYKRLQVMLQNVQSFSGQFQGGRYSQDGRQQALSLLTQLDQEITNDLHDDEMSHMKNWDPRKKDWKSANYWNKDWNSSSWNWNKGGGWNGGNQPASQPGYQPGWNGGGNNQPNWNNKNNNWNGSNNFNSGWNKKNNNWNNDPRDFNKKEWKKFNRMNNQQQQGMTKPPNWMISKDGGYFDGTGQIKVLVPGNELYKYGGTLQDGRPVPNSPNVQMNSTGHIIGY